tara:strand:+ start:32 stop:544 length:513 start_codon:yes stop_codon:yes gene_type:complete
MSKLYNAAKKAFFEPAKKAITKIAQKTSGQGPTRGQTINYVKPKLTNLEGEKKKAVLKAKSDVMKSFGPVNERLRNQTVDMRQTLQKIRKEPITKSGISKGKDVTPGIYESAAKGRKKLRFGGVSGKKSNVQKIKETFEPKGNVPNKYKGFSKLPEAVQQKINKKLAKKV